MQLLLILKWGFYSPIFAPALLFCLSKDNNHQSPLVTVVGLVVVGCIGCVSRDLKVQVFQAPSILPSVIVLFCHFPSRPPLHHYFRYTLSLSLTVKPGTEWYIKIWYVEANPRLPFRRTKKKDRKRVQLPHWDVMRSEREDMILNQTQLIICLFGVRTRRISASKCKLMRWTTDYV